MALVSNSIVKMDWEKSGWLQTKASSKGSAKFIFASKEYFSNKLNAKIAVFFRSDCAWIWADAGTDDTWSVAELKDWAKTNVDGSFPHMYSEFIPVIESGDVDCEMAVLERFGLVEYKDDIEARLRDIKPYGFEKDEPSANV